MKHKKKKWSSMATLYVLVICAFAGTANGQRLYLEVNRDTGEINAIPSGNFEVDGYTITSPSGLLNPEAWNSLADQGSAGWDEANPRNQQLSELNWEGAGALEAGTPVPLGSPYMSAGIPPLEEDLGFQFSTPSGDLIQGGVQYTGASQVPGITVNRESGLIEVANPLGFEITGYSITSPSGGLRPDSFDGLADQSVAGWEEANPTNTRVSELNLENSLVVDASSPFNVGNAFTPGGTEDLEFEYLTIENELSTGLVSYTGPPTDLTLQVDLLSGEAKIQNLSTVSGEFDIIGYSVFSESESLAVEGWTSFADTGAAGDGWEAANPSGAAIAELNPTGVSALFDAGRSISIGNIFTGAEDLVFEYGTTDGAAFGTVEYILGDTPVGPTCQDIADMRIGGDFDGDGVVQFGDLVILSDNFGQSVSSYEQGDADCDGVVQFGDLVILSDNFGMSQGAVAAAVPEPSSAVMAVMGLLACVFRRIRR